MATEKSGNFVEMIRQWAPTITVILAMITFIAGYNKTEVSKESQMAVLVQNQGQMAKDISELKTIVSSYNVVVNDIKRLDERVSVNSERVTRLEAVQSDRAAIVAGLKIVSDLQQKMLDSVHTDIKKLQERANSH